MFTQNNFHNNVHCSFIHSNTTLKTTQMCRDRRMDKWIVVYSDSAVFKEMNHWYIQQHGQISKKRKVMIQWKKPDRKVPLLRSSGRQTNLWKWKTDSGCLWRMREEWWSGKEQEGFPGLWKSSIPQSVWWLYVYMYAIKIH